ncbi:MAG: hypothetical protein ABI614_17045 [Planctomycetota bacterium]
MFASSCSGDNPSPSFHVDGQDAILESQAAVGAEATSQTLLLFSKPTILRRFGNARKVDDLPAKLFWLESRHRDQTSSQLLWLKVIQTNETNQELLPRSIVLSVQKPGVVGLAWVDALSLYFREISLKEQIQEYRLPTPDELQKSLTRRPVSLPQKAPVDSVLLPDLIRPRPIGRSFYWLPKQIDSLQWSDDAWKINVIVGSERFEISNRNKEWALQREQ